MSIIAYRDGVLASDSACFRSGVVTNVNNKMLKGPDTGWLYGFVGTYPLAHRVQRWIEKGEGLIIPHVSDRLDTLISLMADIHKDAKDDNQLTLIIVRDEKTVDMIGPHGYERNIEDYKGYAAIGGSFELALGAMYMGATAVEAVETCLYHSEYAKGKINTLSLG